MVLLKLIIILFLCSRARSQICKMTNNVLQNVTETYRYTSLEPYEDEDCVFFCKNTRLVFNIESRVVEKLVEETIDVCCEGYVKDEDCDENSISCTPICDPPCQNGYCWRPDQCACYIGYTLNPKENNNCSPINTSTECVINFNDSEEEVTKNNIENTYNSDDIEIYKDENTSDDFKCDIGYTRHDKDCIPQCANNCENGECIAPNKCVCYPGWFMDDDKTICQPHCDMCNGNCVAPNVCKCFYGYRNVGNDTNTELQCVVDVEQRTIDTNLNITDFVNVPGLYYPDQTEKVNNESIADEICEYYKVVCNVNDIVSDAIHKLEEFNRTVNSSEEKAKIENVKTSEIPFIWIYILTAIGLALILLFIIIIILKKKSFYQRRNTLTFEDKPTETITAVYRKEV